MPTSIDRFRSSVRQLTRDKAPGAVRYPAQLRAAAVALAHPRVRGGPSFPNQRTRDRGRAGKGWVEGVSLQRRLVDAPPQDL
jgi:hypothetical protein